MPGPVYAPLDARAVLTIAGEERVAFLHGLVSNDVSRAEAGDRAVYAALLTAQGKYLHDFFIVASGDTLLLDAEAARLADLKKRLSIYRLRSKVTIDEAPELAVAATFGEGALDCLGLPAEPGAAQTMAGGVAFTDPRLAGAGARVILPRDALASTLDAAGLTAALASDYDRHRLALGLPDGSRDLVVEKSILLENGFDELHGVDWDKGCYLGQELTARTHYRGLIKKRLMPVSVDGPLPEPGAIIELDGQDAGEMRSGADGCGLALLRLEAVEKSAASGAPLTAGAAKLTPRKPDWAKF
jgi:folate-binding protein YgfZ